MQSRACSIDGCEKPHYGRGWCRHHYDHWRRDGNPLAPNQHVKQGSRCKEAECSSPPTARGWCNKHYKRWRQHGNPAVIKIAPKGSGNVSSGYRRITVNGKLMLEHRKVMAEKLGRDLLPTEDVHHKGDKLDNRPEMLELMEKPDHARLHKTRERTCSKGHEWSKENTYRTKRGTKECRVCRRHRYRLRKRDRGEFTPISLG